jgi:hypothetical protein
MMDEPNSGSSVSGSSLLGLGTSGMGSLASPYLDFDPKIINPGANEAQWIFPDGSINKPTRGRFELAFSQIGGSVMIGGGLGSFWGGINGIKAARSLEGASSAIRRTQILNYVTKNGANTANTFGVAAVIYSIIGVGLSFVNENQDDLNTVTSAVATGLLYGGLSDPKINATATSVAKKLTPLQARLKRSAIGSLMGLCFAGAYITLMSRDNKR